MHRKAIKSGLYPFEQLLEPNKREAFSEEMLNFYKAMYFTAFTVTIDKLAMRKKYEQSWLYDPYHLSMKLMIERYVLWLAERNGTGDIMAESRGGAEDRRLKKSYSRLYLNGTDYLNKSALQRYLTSVSLKVKPKSANVPGLQVADLIAHPCFKRHHSDHNKVPPELTQFESQLMSVVCDKKYHRSKNGEIEGYGRKWLP